MGTIAQHREDNERRLRHSREFALSLNRESLPSFVEFFWQVQMWQKRMEDAGFPFADIEVAGQIAEEMAKR